MGRPGGDAVLLAHLAGEALGQGLGHRFDGHQVTEGGESSQHYAVGHRPAEVFTGQGRRRHGQQPLLPEVLRELAQAELVEAAFAVQKDVGIGIEAGEQLHLVEQGRVLDDQRVRFGNRFTGADRLVVDPAEGDHRGASPFGTEGGESLRVAAFVERGHGQKFCGGDHTLTAPAVNAYLEQVRLL